MRSPIVALIWERWRRTRWLVIAAVLIPVLCVVWKRVEIDLTFEPPTEIAMLEMPASVRTPEEILAGKTPEPFDAVNSPKKTRTIPAADTLEEYIKRRYRLEFRIAAMDIRPILAIILAVLFLFSPFTMDSQREIHLGLSRRHLRLPVKTSRLLMVHGGYSTACAAAVCGSMAAAMLLLWPSPDVAKLGWIFVLWMFAYTILQTVAWCVGPWNATVGIVATGMAILWAAASLNYIEREVPDSSMPFALLTSGLAAGCFMLSWRVANMDRHRRQLGSARWVSRLKRGRRARGNAFRSPLDAQAWFEWRSRARYYPIAIPGFLAGSVLASTAIREYMFSMGATSALAYDAPSALLYFSSSLFVMATLFAGLIIFLNGHRNRAKNGDMFVFARPVQSRDISLGLVRAMFRATLASGIIVALFMAGCAIVVTRGAFIRHWASAFQLVPLDAPFVERLWGDGAAGTISLMAMSTGVFLGIMILVAAGMLVLMWLALWFGWAFLGLAAIVVVAIAVTEASHGRIGFLENMVGPVFLLALGGLCAIIQARRQGHLTPRDMARIALFWLVSAALLAGMGWWYSIVSEREYAGLLSPFLEFVRDTIWPDPFAIVASSIALGLLVVTPAGLLPMLAERRRHQ